MSGRERGRCREKRTDSVADDFNVELVEVLGGETISKVGSCIAVVSFSVS